MKNPAWLLLLFLMACGRHIDPPGTYDFTPNPFIMLSFNEQKEFKLDSVYFNSFGFSPVKVNHIWAFTDYDGTYDLNLETGVWSKLEGALASFAPGLKNDHIYKDTYDPDLTWFNNHSKGLGLYDRVVDSLRVFQDIRSLTCMLFDTADIWIGTFKGLYHYDRRTKDLTIVEPVAEIPIQQLTPYGLNRLNIDGRYIYDYDLGHLEKLDDMRGIIPLSVPYSTLNVVNDNNQSVTIKAQDGRPLYTFPYFSWKTILYEENTIWIPSNELYEGLARIDVRGEQVDTIPVGYYFAVNQISGDSRYVWLSNRSEAMAINKQTGEAHYWSLPFGSQRTIAYQDIKYIYLHDRHSVIIIPKTKVFSESTPLVKIKEEEELFNYLLDSTRISYTHEIRPWYRSYRGIQALFDKTTSPRILASLSNIRAMVGYMAPDEYPPFDDTLFSFMDSIDEPDVRAAFSHSLMIYAARKGRLDRAIELDNKLKVQLPAGNSSDYSERQKMEIRKAYQALQALEGKAMPEDERLWKTGNIYVELFHHIGRETEASGMVMDYPFTFFTELLRKYPSSPWADNAEYLMFSYEEGSSHEGGDTGYNIEANEAYKKFIKRYPDSELIPEIYLRIAGLYFDYGTGQEDRKKYLEAAKVYTDKFYKEYPGHALTSEADQFLSYLDDELDKLHWSLTIQAGKTTYAKNEPVLITYTLRNGAPRPKTIKMYADTSYSNFSQYVTFSPIEAMNEGRYVMIEIYPQKLSSEMKEVIIQSGQTYTETKDMTKWVKAESFGNQGYYIMEQPGEYLVKAFFRYDNLNVQSNDLRIWRK